MAASSRIRQRRHSERFWLLQQTTSAISVDVMWHGQSFRIFLGSLLLVFTGSACHGATVDAVNSIFERSASQQQLPEPPREIAEFFEAPRKYRSDLGNFRSPLLFADGTLARTPADWQRRRAEILGTWQSVMGPWPPLIEKPRVGVADLPERWPAVNHAIAVNKLLGFDHRVALTARQGHTPTAEANEQACRFFEWSLHPPN